jgi:hypothetical protein
VLLQPIDHIRDGLARLITQYRGKPRLTAWVAIFLEQIQLLDDAIELDARLFEVDTAVGWRLDVVGSWVGQARIGSTDAVYRLYIKARIRANRSIGRVSDVRAVATMLLGASSYTYDEYSQNIIITDLTGNLVPETALAVHTLLQQTAGAGVRVWLYWNTGELAYIKSAEGYALPGPAGYDSATPDPFAGRYCSVIS